jgi:hypothetical protein
MGLTDIFLFWRTKTPEDNLWHPLPYSLRRHDKNAAAAPSSSEPWNRINLAAAAVDTAPFVAGAGALAHISQLNSFGFTAHASVFKNPRTLTTMNRATLVLFPAVLVCQMMDIQYRYAIPRWCSVRERRRDEDEARKHVLVGMDVGFAVWAVRLFVLGLGRRYWGPVDAVISGALADLMLREWWRTHDGNVMS